MKKGFSLIEILLIVALVAITFAGVMALTQRILQMENVVKNDFIAEGLLREGLELVKAAANENMSAGMPYYTWEIAAAGQPPPYNTPYLFAIDWQGVNISSATMSRDLTHLRVLTGTSDPSARLKFSSTNGYQLTSGDNTPFVRYVTTQFKQDGGRNYLDVEVVVYWEERGKGHTSHAHTRLYDPTITF